MRRNTRIIDSLFFYLILFLPGISICQVSGQDNSLKHNNLSVSPLTIIDRTIPLSYSRYLNDQWNFTIYARYRIRKKDDPTIEPGIFELYYPNQPHLYSRTYLRSGVQYHGKWFMAEPLLQFDYGWMTDQWLIVDVTYENYAELQDRHYYSGGVIFLVGTYHDFNLLRIRTFCGVGSHMKYFEIHAKDVWNNDPELYPCNYDYMKFMISVHFGVEIGVNF
jgi:hypothetical protein